MSKTANWHKAPEILVVDDEADIRELIAGILKDDGYETRLAKDADGAVALWTLIIGTLVTTFFGWLLIRAGEKADGAQIEKK